MTADAKDVLVVGAGPAGVVAALRSADLGARTTLVTSGECGGMAAHDGPVPVRALAQAARLMRDAGKLQAYGIRTAEPELDYPALLGRVADIVREVRSHSMLREQVDRAGVIVHERVGPCRFVGPRTVESPSGQRFEGGKIILCTGGRPRRLPIPGAEHLATHSDAWALRRVPRTMLVIGGGATGLQVASIFAAFGTRVAVLEAGPRLLPQDDEDVAAAVAQGFRQRGIVLLEGCGAIERCEARGGGVRLHVSHPGGARAMDAELAICAIGWRVDAAALALPTAGIETDERGFVRVDERGRTSAADVYAAGDATGRGSLVPQAIRQGYRAASAALGCADAMAGDGLVPVGSFTDPEYARVGLSEKEAGGADAIVASVPFARATRPIIDGQSFGFCKLIADRSTRRILGCHVVGDRAVDIVQVAAVAMAGEMPVDRLAHFPMSFPTYAGVLAQAAAALAYRLNRGA